jgi:hypothetical protein
MNGRRLGAFIFIDVSYAYGMDTENCILNCRSLEVSDDGAL